MGERRAEGRHPLEQSHALRDCQLGRVRLGRVAVDTLDPDELLQRMPATVQEEDGWMPRIAVGVACDGDAVRHRETPAPGRAPPVVDEGPAHAPLPPITAASVRNRIQRSRRRLRRAM